MKKARNSANIYSMLKKILHFFLCGLLFFFLVRTNFAIGSENIIKDYQYKIWSIKEGLPQNSIRAIIQTSDGYIWLGTHEGLLRFNGLNFKSLNFPDAEKLKTSQITALFEDNRRFLWIGTWGNGIYCLRKEKIIHFSTNEGVANNIIRCIAGDKNGSIWIGTWGGGLNQFKEGEFNTYTTNEGLTSNYISSIFIDNQNTLWIGTLNGGLNQFKNGRFKAFTTKEGLDNDTVLSIYKDSRENLWIGTEGGALNKLKDEKIYKYKSKKGLFGHYILSLLEDKEKNLWIGTWGGGLYRLKSNKFIVFTTKDGLSSNIITTVYEGREGCLWIGTEDGGLNRLKRRKFKIYSTREGLSMEMVRTIFQDSKGNIWIGTGGGGLNLFKDKKFFTYSITDGLSSNDIRSIFEDKKGTLLIGTYGGGLNLFKDGKFSYYSSKNGLSGNFIISINEDHMGNIWAGTWGDGLNRIKNEKIKTYTMKDGLSNDNIMAIHEDKSGNLWIGTGGGGLIRLKNEKFTTFTTRQGLSGNYILSLHEDREGVLWIGTYNNGLNRLKDNKFTPYRVKNGLFSDIIFQILEDNADNLWMSCNKGIFKVNKKDLNNFAMGIQEFIKSISYNNSDGMESNECNGANQPAGWKSNDGSLWFPTTRGVVVIKPNQIGFNSVVPPVFIEKVKIDDQFFTPEEISKISPGKQKFEFYYTALSFVAPQKIRFKYRLENIDNNWVEAGTRRVAFYTNLSPGKYCFKVIACNNDGLWNKQGASLEFFLKPMFYQTIWFYGLAVILLSLVITIIHLIRVRQIIIREQKKYEKSRLTPEKTEKHLKKLLQYMESENPYLDPNLTLNRLSHQTSIPIHHISQIINAQLKQNFFDFINTYRIEEAKKRMNDPRFRNLSILQIAFDVGFNSKSAFNRAFKKHTKMTPFNYKKNK